MRLRSLQLENIRSHVQTRVEFPKGITLLRGDIGSGKSTILQGIEFALFGILRGILSGTNLLRHGETKGSVTLAFEVQGKEIFIKRTLKRSKERVEQNEGVLIIDEVVQNLTPTELKVRILELLGYPLDLLNKSKSMVYRYTVYTPQESMKQVLQETAEIRLDLLRKIFNVDKYKVIRENVQLFLKKLRVTLAVLNTKLEPLPEQEEKFIALKNDISIVEMKLEELVPEKLFYEEKLQGFRGKLEREKEKEKLCLEKKRELQTISSLIDRKSVV